ncbi:MAG TPA: GNAT family N-acetyltransferase [Myxococcota bacterium]|nr:GNAT family N-acetyltransferase [Myxococcota bacterium]
MIRAATEEDLLRIAELGDEAERQGWTLEQLRGGLESGLKRVVVAGEGSWAIGQAVAGEAHILDVRVAPKRRRRGLGSALVEALVEACEAEVAHLEVRADNTGAVSLYESLGFEVVGRRAAYYGGCDALLMSRP